MLRWRCRLPVSVRVFKVIALPKMVFTLRVLSAQLDGKSVHMMVRDAEGAVSNSDNQLRPGVSMVPGSTGHLARGSKLNVQVEVKTFVTDRDTLVRSREQWEGSGQFSIDTL